MRGYLARWGGYPDARICSCGAAWSDCPFWGELEPVWGTTAGPAPTERYRRLLERLRHRYGDDAVVVDSSKTLASLELLLAERRAIGLGDGELRVVLAVKDARSFVASALGKRGARRSLLATARAFRWWHAANRELFAAVERSGAPFAPSLYERLCWAPDEHCAELAARLGLQPVAPPAAGRPRAHIAIGNKDYLNHTRGRVRYDDRWLRDDRIQLVYLLLPAVRRFNRELQARCAAAEAEPAR